MQRSLVKNKNVVCEGRDIGSVVFPYAEIKFFLECNIDERTNRRYNQYKKNNISIKKDELKQLILERDKNDTKRKNSPLKRMNDSIIIDTSNLKVEDVIILMCNKIKEKYVE